MRKKGIIIFFLFFVSLLWGLEMEKTINFDFSKIQVKYRNGYTILDMEGAAPYIIPGAPELPVVPIKFIIPPDKDVESIEVLHIEEIPFLQDVIIKPAHIPGAPGHMEPQYFPPDPQYYEKVTYPDNVLQFVGTGGLGGYRIASFLAFPLKYRPRDNEVTFIKSITFKLILKPSTPPPAPYRKEEGALTYFKKFVKKIVINRNEVEIYGPSILKEAISGKFAPKTEPSRGGSPVSFVIIAQDEVAEPFYEFAEWKTKLGYPAVVKTISWIQGHYEGIDLAEKIRNFIRDAYENWGIQWVLLAGDHPELPARYAYIPLTSNYFFNYIPTDMYYACLEGNWNFDGDTLWGELEDSTDIYPDIFIGRAPVRDLDEAQLFVDKTKSYKLHPGGDVKEEYLIRALLHGSDQFSVGDGCEQINYIIPSFPDYFEIVIMCEDSTYSPTSQEYIDSLYSGFGQVFSTAHGNFNSFKICYTPNQDFMRYNADELENTTTVSFFNILSCEPSGYDFDCVSEHLIRAEGGAVGVWGTSRYNYPYIGKRYVKTFYDSLFTSEMTEMGAVHTLTLLTWAFLGEYIYNHYRYLNMGYNLLGDPTTSLWTQLPERYIIDVEDYILYVGENDVKVTILSMDSGSPAPDVVVTAYKDGEVYEKAKTDITGRVFLHIVPVTTGAVEITASSGQGVPEKIRLVVVDSVAFVSIVDKNVVESDGDNDGILDASETADIRLLLYNGGRIPTQPLYGVLSTEDQYIEILEDSVFLGVVTAHDSIWSENRFVVRADSLVPDSHKVIFEVLFLTDASSTNSPSDTFVGSISLDTISVDTFSLYVRASELMRYDHSLTQNNDTFSLRVSIRNTGGDYARSIIGVLSASSGVDFIDSVIFYDVLEPGGILPDSLVEPFRFLLSVPIDSVTFILSLYDTVKYHGDFPIMVRSIYFASRLDYKPQLDGIYLYWYESDDSLSLGYYVYRSLTETGPFERITPDPIEYPFYEDKNVSYYEPYYYKVSMVDSFFNESNTTSVVEAYTNPSLLQNWPAQTGLYLCFSPLVIDFDPEYPGLEVVAVGKFSGKITAYYSDGNKMEGWPYEMGDGNEVYGAPAAGDLDSDGELEIVVAPWGPANEVFALEMNGQLVSGWPRPIQGSTSNKGTMGVFSTPAVADLDGDGMVEVVVKTTKGYIYVWHGDGTGYIDTSGFFYDLPDDAWSYSSPSVADVDGNDTLEIIVGTNSGALYIFKPSGEIFPNFPITLSRDGHNLCIMSSLAIADFDISNPGLEIAVAGSLKVEQGGSWLYLIGIEGDTLPGWPQQITMPIEDWRFAPAAADVDNDGEIEVIINTGDDIRVYNPDGVLLAGFPAHITGVPAPPVVLDTDNDGKCEVFVQSYEGYLAGLEWDGDEMSRFPIFMGGAMVSIPAFADMNSDGKIELIAGGADDKIWVFTMIETYNPSMLEWPTFKHDPSRTGWYENPSTFYSAVNSALSTLPKILTLSQNSPNPFRSSTNITLALPQKTDVEIVVYDVTGRKVRRIFRGSLEAGCHQFIWDGKDDNRRKLPSGIYFYSLRTPEKRITKKALLIR